MLAKRTALYITRMVKMRIDFNKKRAVLTCKTNAGQTVDLEADLETLDEINAAVRKQLETY
jgi:hypothetical protein